MTNGQPPQSGQPPPEGYPQGGQPQYPQQGPQDPQHGQPSPGGGYPQHPQQQSGYGQPQAAYGGGPSGPRAGFWQRVGAYIIDFIITSVPLLIGFAFLGGFDDDQQSQPLRAVNTGDDLGYQLVATAIAIAYFTLLEGGSSGQTVGKRALSIRVIHQQTGGSIGNPRALGRNAVRSLPGLIPGINLIWGLLDPLWMLWDREKQTLHDKAAGTLVVPVAAYPIQRPGDVSQQQSYGQQPYGGQQQQGYGQPPGTPPPSQPPPGGNNPTP